MSINALHVYDTMTFTTDMPIETMAGELIGAGEITLQPGTYRYPADANLVAQTAPKARSYRIVSLTDTKGGTPDPPSALGGAGKQNDLQ
jgi:hypothetical protein